MKKWLATAALALTPPLADASEHAEPTTEHTEPVDHPTSEKHAGEHDHTQRRPLPMQFHVRLEVLGRIMNEIDGGESEMVVEPPRGFGELEVTIGKPGRMCTISVAEEFEGRDLALETAAVGCKIGWFDVDIGRGIAFRNVLRRLNPNLGIGFVETEENGAKVFPLVDESLRFTGHFGPQKRWSIMTGIAEGRDKIDFSEPQLLAGVQYTNPNHTTVGVQTALGRDGQNGQIYGSVDFKGFEVAADILYQDTKNQDWIRFQGYVDYSHAIKGDWIIDPYVRVASDDMVAGDQAEGEDHRHEVQAGVRLRMPHGFAVFAAFEHVGNGHQANGGMAGISFSGTIQDHH